MKPNLREELLKLKDEALHYSQIQLNHIIKKDTRTKEIEDENGCNPNIGVDDHIRKVHLEKVRPDEVVQKAMRDFYEARPVIARKRDSIFKQFWSTLGCEFNEGYEKELTSLKNFTPSSALGEIIKKIDSELKFLPSETPLMKVKLSSKKKSVTNEVDRKNADPLINKFICKSGLFYITFNDNSFELKASKGLRYLAYLIQHTSELRAVKVRALSQIFNPKATTQEAQVPEEEFDTEREVYSNISEKISDRKSIKFVSSQIEELEESRIHVISEGGKEDVDEKMEKMKKVLTALKSRPKSKGKEAIKKAINRAISSIAKNNSPLSKYLKENIKTGFQLYFSGEMSSWDAKWNE